MNGPRILLSGALAVALGALVAGGAFAQQPAPAEKPAKAATKKKPPVELAKEARALDILKAASAKLAAAKSMSFKAVATYEFPSQLGPALAYTTASDVVMQRPDKLRVITLGDGPASEFYYDGKAMMAYAPAENLLAVADAPPTLEAALAAAYKTAAIYFPFTDLLLPDPYAAFAHDLRLAFYIGQSKVVGGTTTDMLAVANNEVFLQIWIGAQDKLPRRIRAVFRGDPLRLRHDLELSNWQLDGTVAANAFAPAKAEKAARISFAAPTLPKSIAPVKPPAKKAAPAKAPEQKSQ